MVEKAGTRNKGLEESLNGLRKLVDKMKLEGTSKQVVFGKAIERLIKMVDGINEKSNMMEKVAMLPKTLSSLFSHVQGVEVDVEVEGAFEKLGKQMVEKVGTQNTEMKQMVEKIGTQNTGLKQMVEKFGTQNAGIKESVEGLKGVVQKMNLNSTTMERVIYYRYRLVRPVS